MALFDGGLLGGGSADPYDLYGDILTAKQREALRARSSDQTWANAANFLAKAAMPTNKKIPLGGLLAGLAGAMGGSNQDEAVQTALKGALTTQQIAKLRREQKLLAELDPIQKELLRRQLALGGGGAPAAAPGVPPAVAPTPAAPTAGMPPPMIVPPQPPVPAGGFPPGSGVPPGATTALPAATQMAGYMTAPENTTFGGANNPYAGLLALVGGGSGPDPFAGLLGGGDASGTLPFDLASLGTSQSLPDVGPVRVEALSGEADPARSAYEAKRARDLDLTERYESGGRNIMQQVIGPQGGYNPSVGRVTGPSSASGLYQMIKPTYEHAAKLAGIDVSQWPRAMDAPPAVQRKLAEALYDEQGNRPWDPYNKPLAAARGGGGLPNVGGVRIEPLGGEAAPAGGSGTIPGLGITPEALATLNSMYKAAGIDSPFGSLLETYYKSPGYLGEVKRQGEQIETEFAGKKAGAAAAATQKYIQENETHKSGLDLARDLIGKGVYLDKATNTMKPITNAAEALAEIDRVKEENKARNEIVTVTLTPPGASRPQEMQVTRAQARDIAEGRGVPALGIPAMTGIKIGKPVYNPTETALGPIEAKDIFEKRDAASDAATMLETNKEARKLIDGGILTGFASDRLTTLAKLGNALNLTGATTQETVANTESYLATVAGNVGKMIKLFGAGTGLSNADRDYAAMMVAGKQTLDEASIRRILDINDRASLNIIKRHNQRVSTIAPGSTLTDLKVQEPEPYVRAVPEGTVIQNDKGERQIRRGGKWEPM